MTFFFKSRASREAEELAKQQRIESEKAEKAEAIKAEKAAANRELTHAVNNLIKERRMSNEQINVTPERRMSPQTTQADAYPVAQGAGERPTRARANSVPATASHKKRRPSKEVEHINSLVKKIDSEWTERKAAARRNTEEAQTLEQAARAAAAAISLTEESVEENIEVSHRTGAQSERRMADRQHLTLAEKIAAKHGTAKERLAGMQRETEERKRRASGESMGEDQSTTTSKAAAVGHAKAAAKVAGGVFYTHEDHRDMLQKMKDFHRENDELKCDVANLRSQLDALREERSRHGGSTPGTRSRFSFRKTSSRSNSPSPSFIRNGKDNGDSSFNKRSDTASTLSGSMRQKRGGNAGMLYMAAASAMASMFGSPNHERSTDSPARDRVQMVFSTEDSRLGPAPAPIRPSASSAVEVSS